MKNKITDSELLLIDIYDHFLCREGDRSNYPLPQIEKHLNSLGIDVRDEVAEENYPTQRDLDKWDSDPKD